MCAPDLRLLTKPCRRATTISKRVNMQLRKITPLVMVFLAAILLVPLASVQAGEVFPKVFNVPDGWQPEGIAVGRGSSFYVGSLLHGGVYGGDLRTGEGEVVVAPQEGRIAVGLDVDVRSNAIFVAGGGPILGFPIPGSAYVFDADTGAERCRGYSRFLRRYRWLRGSSHPCTGGRNSCAGEGL